MSVSFARMCLLPVCVLQIRILRVCECLHLCFADSYYVCVFVSVCLPVCVCGCVFCRSVLCVFVCECVFAYVCVLLILIVCVCCRFVLRVCVRVCVCECVFSCTFCSVKMFFHSSRPKIDPKNNRCTLNMCLAFMKI